MSDSPLFEVQRDYDVPLLRLLYQLPNGQGETAEVMDLFEVEYGDRIPKEHRVIARGRDSIWKNNVRWCRNYLKERGFLDGTTHGIWRITDEGRRWVEENPDADRLPLKRNSKSRSSPSITKRKMTLEDLERKKATMSEEDFECEWGSLYQSLLAKSHKSTRSQLNVNAIPGLTFEMLELTKQSMLSDQFRQIWGTIYDQLLAEERAKAITPITSAELGPRVKRKLDEIHSFLQGRQSAPPQSHILCDWIHLCYELELHREVASLWHYVHENEVEPGYYRRAKKWAEGSRARLG